MTRDRLLGQARADLVALPDLVAELARLVADHGHHDVSGYHAKVVGSPAPLSIPVLHITDHRRKPGWDGDHPQMNRIPDRYGAAPMLESWVRVLAEEMIPDWPELTEHATVRSESTTLLEHWSFIDSQQWAVELAEDVTRLAGQVRAHLGIKPEPEYACAQCGNRAYLQPGGILACTEQPDHDLVVRDLEAQMRRRPALPTKDICEEFGVEAGTLRVWKHRRRIRPDSQGNWFPWDVFCLLNPDIAEAFAAKDETSA